MTELQVSGMTCQNCARRVTEAIQGVSGVHSASVMLDAGRATVRWNPEAQTDVAAVLAAIKDAGYEANLIEAASREHGKHRQSAWQRNLILGIAVTVVLMSGEWILGLDSASWFQWISFVLAGVIQIFAGAKFYRGAWNQLKIGGSNMDTLVALGSTTAFGYSAWALLVGAGGHLYFMEAAAIITIISVGHWLEARVSVRASAALEKLLNLTPQTAWRLVGRADLPVGQDARQRVPTAPESAIEVPISKLQIGDLVALRPGDRVPTDGVVVEGDSTADEAMLTGESAPVDKKSGSELFAGTINLNGRLVMRVTATGEATALAQIIAAVQRAQTSRADIQRLGDRVSNVFVPVVVLTAVAAAFWWGLAPQSAKQIHDSLAPFLWQAMTPEGAAAAFIIAAAILIVACPCAMGLATPAAIMAGANAASRHGILIRDGVALEKADKITAVIFDKTGTLTVGKPEVADVCGIQSGTGFQPVKDNTTGRRPVPRLTALAVALACSSTHPISQAVAASRQSADDRIFTNAATIKDWKEIHGSGIEAQLVDNNPQSSILNPQLIKLGSLRWLKESGVDLVAGEKFIAEWSAQGATVIGLASDKNLLGLFAVRDSVKSNAADVVKRLQRQGLKIYLATGDNSLTAFSIAKQAGIAAENVFAEVHPEQKAAFVKKLQAKGERVAFVGDGINDAPALEQADLGIAVSRASDIAREAADIILLNSEIEAVPEALGLARATLRTIKQNLFWAFFYNALGVPLAALGFISPILCAAAMGASDLIVIGNALRLLRWKKL